MNTSPQERLQLIEDAQQLAHLGAWAWNPLTGEVVGSAELFRLYALGDDTHASTLDALLAHVHPDDLFEVREILTQAGRSGTPFSVEHRVTMRTEIRWIRLRGRTERAPDGTMIRIYGTAQDITPEREVLSRVEADERRFRDLIENAPDAILLFAANGTMIYANEQAALMFGYDRDRFIDLQIEDLIPPEATDRIEGDEPPPPPESRPMGVGIDLEGVRRDGTRFPLDMSLSPIRGADGMQVLCFVRDMTEQRAFAEAAMRRRQALEINDQVVQGLATALHALDTHDLAATRVSLERTVSNARTMMGSLTMSTTAPIKPGDLVRAASIIEENATPLPRPEPPLTTGDLRVVIADDTPAIRQMLRLLLDEVGGMRVVGEAGDGRQAVRRVVDLAPDVLLLDLAMPEMDGLQVLKRVRTKHPDTAVVIVSGYAREHLLDVTEGLGADAYIEKGAPTPLVIASLRAVRDEVNERRGITRTPGAASAEAYELYLHELRLPLEAAAQAAGVLTSRGSRLTDVDRADLLMSLNSNLGQADMLLRLISDATHIEDRTLQVQRKTVDLDRLLRNFIDDEARNFPHHRLMLISAGTLHGIADPPRIEEILHQLVRNAATSAPKGSTITVMLSHEDDAAVIRVIDEGPGIPSHFRPRLFGRFQRLDPSTPGVGLGLHVARAVARAHDGDLELEDGRPENCVFKLTLTAVPTPPTAAD